MISLKPEWYQAIKVRRSRREFITKPIADDVINALTEFSNELNRSLAGVRTVLVTEKAEEIFKGAIGSYGKIKGATAYVAFIGGKNDENVQEKLGYMGECFILEATSIGLSTCWVGGFFKPEVVARQINVSDDEEVLSVSPLGYTKEKLSLEENIMSGLASSPKRKNLTQLCRGLTQEEWPDWVKAALEAARLAPSAVNRQPWRFEVDKESIKVSVNNQRYSHNISKRLDCGISMLHLELGALSKGVKGTWEYLTAPDVAVFTKEQ
ncbi:nitroreductase family protein [Metallumcola ferriviriculae]|uniref:Nitroreductase family protein n=1 Tax=Metallumcola ferriviriculae TaxID=3039180 RepID=A0AAU0UJQ8_9FIRM|nr:nitroreductase family protein [Desulfitibacteraceae bacterium MK1]